MDDPIVYSLKINREQLGRAKRFLARQGGLLQDSLRDLIEAAADCEQCLELHEEEASITELQSAFATLLAKCKDAWLLNRLLQEAVMRIAKRSKIPVEFVANVLGEARRAKAATRRI
jgi:DNA-directed RNA polymerase specialized sigma24 family protein